MNIAIIQARLGSVRLPKKVLLEVPPDSGVNMLQRVIRRVKKSKVLDKVIVALAADSKSLVPLVEGEGVGYSFYPNGERRNVLAEYYFAAREHGAKDKDLIVRITSDCPCIDPKAIDQMLEYFNPLSDELLYNHNDSISSCPIEIDGLDIEVMTFEALEKAYKTAKEPEDLEHVTKWMYKNLKSSRVQCGWTDSIRTELYPDNIVRLSVNTEEDYQRVCQIYASLGEDFDTRYLMNYLSL